MKRFSCLFIVILFVIFIVVGCSPDTLLDPNDPVILTMWHVYGEQANSPMNELVDEFNSTLGRDRGIIINVTHISNAYQIGQQLKAAQKGILGASNMPDLFFCHNNNAQELGTQNLVDWNNYFSQDELAHYVGWHCGRKACGISGVKIHAAFIYKRNTIRAFLGRYRIYLR